MIDPCSQVSFITRRIVRSLKIPCKNSNVSVAGVRNSIAAFSLPDFVKSVEAYFLETLRDFLPSANRDLLVQEFFGALTAADLSLQRSCVDKLIGTDLFADIILDGIHLNNVTRIVA